MRDRSRPLGYLADVRSDTLWLVPDERGAWALPGSASESKTSRTFGRI